MKINNNKGRLKTYKIKNHDSGKTYSVKAVSYTDAVKKYNKHILEDAAQPVEFTASIVFTSDKPKTRGTNKGYTRGSYGGGSFNINQTIGDVITNFYNYMKKDFDDAASANIRVKKLSIAQHTRGKKSFRQLVNIREVEGKDVQSAIQIGNSIKLSKYIKDSLTEDGWSSYTFKTGLRSDAFKQYLRDRGIYFESSQDGKYTHFEVKNADEAVDRRANEIVRQLKDSITEDAYTKYYLRRIRDKYTFSGVRGMWDEEIASYSFKKQENLDVFISIIKRFVDFNMTKSELLSKGPGFVMSFDNKRQDAITEDAVIYGEWKDKDGVWNVNTNDLQETKRKLRAAGYKYISHDVNMKGLMYKYTVQYTKDSITEDADFYGAAQNSEKADDILFALQVMYGEPKYTYSDFKKMNLSQAEINRALAYVNEKGYDKFSYFDSLTEDADIAQNDIKSSYLPEDANADNIQYLGFNEKRKLSFYSYGDRYFVHYDLEGRTEEIDKATVQKILKKNILGEIDENDLINKEPQAEEIVSDAFEDDSTRVYGFKQGKRADAFKQYLRDRGLKFERSQDGRLVVFVVFNADEAVDRKAIEITRTIRDTFEERGDR